MTECAGAQIHRGNWRNGKAIVQRAYDGRRLGRRRRSDGSNEVSDRRRDDKRLPRAWRIVADSLESLIDNEIDVLRIDSTLLH